jgi:hypothetical protein
MHLRLRRKQFANFTGRAPLIAKADHIDRRDRPSSTNDQRLHDEHPDQDSHGLAVFREFLNHNHEQMLLWLVLLARNENICEHYLFKQNQLLACTQARLFQFCSCWNKIRTVWFLQTD